MAIRLVQSTFGDKKLKDIKTADYQSMLDIYAKNHVKDSTRLLNSYFKKLVKYAINDKIITRDFTFGALIAGFESKDANLKFLESHEAE